MTNGWQTKKLGELCKIELGKTPARANLAYWDEKHETHNVWLSISDLLNAEDDIALDSKEYLSAKGAAMSKLVPEGTLLVSFKLTLGRLAFAGRDLYTNEAIAALTVLDDRELSKKFLFYFLHFFDWVKAAENDVKLKGMTLNKAKLKELQVHFPPIPEQRRIVGALDKAFGAIAAARANAKKNCDNAVNLFESHLQRVFRGRGEPSVEKRLVDVAKDFGRGKSKHRPRNDPQLYGGKYPFIQTGDVRNADHLIKSYTQAYNEVGLKQSKLWPKGTLCITIAANIAETGILDFDACFPDSVIGVVPDESVTTSQFLEYLLRSFKTRLQGQGKGSAQNNINLGTFESQTFPFPPLTVQFAIVGLLDTLREASRRLESIYQQKLTAVEALKQSVLQRAFAGHLSATL